MATEQFVEKGDETLLGPTVNVVVTIGQTSGLQWVLDEHETRIVVLMVALGTSLSL